MVHITRKYDFVVTLQENMILWSHYKKIWFCGHITRKYDFVVTLQENMILWYVTKGTSQYAHPCKLISSYVICYLESIVTELTTCKISIFYRPQIRVRNWKLFFLFLNQNICCGYSKEPSHRDGSFEHPKHMFKLMDKKIITIYARVFLLNWTYDSSWADLPHCLPQIQIVLNQGQIYHRLWHIRMLYLCCCIFQKGDEMPAKTAIDLAPGWIWEDEWQIDLNRAVDEEGKVLP